MKPYLNLALLGVLIILTAACTVNVDAGGLDGAIESSVERSDEIEPADLDDKQQEEPMGLGGETLTLDEKCERDYPNSHYDEGEGKCMCDTEYILSNGACIVKPVSKSEPVVPVVDEPTVPEIEEPQEVEIEEEAYSTEVCVDLPHKEMPVTSLEEDTESNAKHIEMCSVNSDLMNSVNSKYYTFTLSQPTSVHLTVDGMPGATWQVGIIDHSWEDGEFHTPVSYKTELDAGTYVAWVSITDDVSSTCSEGNCYFEIYGQPEKWWIKGSDAGVSKLSYRLSLSRSPVETSLEVPVETSSSNKCADLNVQRYDTPVDHDDVSEAISVSMCDSIDEIFWGQNRQYFKLYLEDETDVKIVLNKPEGTWQIAVEDYGWAESETLGLENVVYQKTLPAGEHLVDVFVKNTAGLGGEDWSCREIVTDGTCYWTSGTPTSGIDYLRYRVSFDRT